MLDRRFPARRQITVGTTLAVDWITHQVRVLLSCARAAQKGALDDQEMNRNEMARSLVERGLVRSKSTLTGPHGRQLRSSLNIVSTGDVLRIRGASRLLHIIQEV